MFSAILDCSLNFSPVPVQLCSITSIVLLNLPQSKTFLVQILPTDHMLLADTASPSYPRHQRMDLCGSEFPCLFAVWLLELCTLGELTRSPFACFFQCRNLQYSFFSKCKCVEVHLPLGKDGLKHGDVVTPPWTQEKLCAFWQVIPVLPLWLNTITIFTSS